MARGANLGKGDRVQYPWTEADGTDLGTVLEVRPVVTVWVKVRWDNDHDPFDPDQTDWYIASQLDVIQ